MLMSWIWTGMVALSVVAAIVTGQGAALGKAVTQGAQSGIQLVISMAGAICLWSALAAVMEHNGMSAWLSARLRPLLGRLIPESRSDPALAGALSANVTANLLGLGNAATPTGIRAAQRLCDGSGVACDSLCRLVVLNSASIQLIPTNVAAIRASLGSAAPFDILPAVWLTSLCAAAAGLTAAWALGKLWRR